MKTRVITTVEYIFSPEEYAYLLVEYGTDKNAVLEYLREHTKEGMDTGPTYRLIDESEYHTINDEKVFSFEYESIHEVKLK